MNTTTTNTLSERLSNLIDRSTTDVGQKVGYAVVAGLPDALRVQLRSRLAPAVTEARHDPEIANELEAPVVSELTEWLEIADAANAPKEEILFVRGMRSEMDDFLLVSVIAQRLYLILRNENEVGAVVREDYRADRDGLIPCLSVSREQSNHAINIMVDRYADDVTEPKARAAFKELQDADLVEMPD